jgi:hypothetical protein
MACQRIGGFGFGSRSIHPQILLRLSVMTLNAALSATERFGRHESQDRTLGFSRGSDRLVAFPLRVIDHLCAVEDHVEVGGNEAGHVPYGLARGTLRKSSNASVRSGANAWR